MKNPYFTPDMPEKSGMVRTYVKKKNVMKEDLLPLPESVRMALISPVTDSVPIKIRSLAREPETLS